MGMRASCFLENGHFVTKNGHEKRGFLVKIFINSAATVFPNIFISFASGRNLKSTIFECALNELPNGIGLLFLAVVEKQLFASFCEFVKFSLALLELMQL